MKSTLSSDDLGVVVEVCHVVGVLQLDGDVVAVRDPPNPHWAFDGSTTWSSALRNTRIGCLIAEMSFTFTQLVVRGRPPAVAAVYAPSSTPGFLMSLEMPGRRGRHGG